MAIGLLGLRTVDEDGSVLYSIFVVVKHNLDLLLVFSCSSLPLLFYYSV